jgi:transcription-repair coupling factor (superfamily II helicase)
LITLLREQGITADPVDDWSFLAAAAVPAMLTVATLSEGFLLPGNLAVVPETALFGERALQSRRRAKPTRDADAIIQNLNDLHIGAPVVHEENGVGRYLGLQTLTINGQPAEFLTLEYADEAKLYVPVSSLHLISRYTGAFAAAFPFEETADQAQAIDAVLADMAASTPMDRVVCGDVGFGKTEVAMRAAFVAVQNDRQVAVLVPTTLLAQQHARIFATALPTGRCGSKSLSRFRSNKDSRRRNSEGPGRRSGGHRDRHPQAAAERDRIHNLGSGHHRRGAPLRRAPEGALKAVARRGGCADPDRHPDPPHPEHGDGGLRDLSIIATAAGGATGHQDLRQ